MRIKTPLLTIVAAIAAALPVASGAAEGEWLVRGNAAYIATDSSSEGIIGDTGLGLVAGTDGADVDDAPGFAFTLSYAYTDNFAISLLASAPFDHDIDGTGALEGLQLGDALHLPPTLVLEYRFNPQGRVNPYVGAGINYTWFLDADTTPALTDALDGIIGGVNSTDLRLEDSVGFAAVAGIDWYVGENWGLNGQLWWADIDTDATVVVNGAVAAEEIDVSIDPLIPQLGLFFEF